MECHGRIRLAARIEHEHCTFSVHDNGPGMPDDVRLRAFEPFYTTKHRGTGPGLPTVKRIIDSHHGSIEIACPASGGTLNPPNPTCVPRRRVRPVRPA